MKEVDEKLKVYVETNILPLYSLNDGAHNLDHIFYVLDRSFRFSEKCHENLDSNMIYTIAVYHDVGHHIDAKNHEKLSADFLENDINLRSFFTEDQIVIMK